MVQNTGGLVAGAGDAEGGGVLPWCRRVSDSKFITVRKKF